MRSPETLAPRWRESLALLVLALSIGATVVSPSHVTGGEQMKWYGYIGWVEESQRVDFRVPTDDSTEGDIWMDGHNGEIAEYCAEESKYFCFRSVGHAFAVPKTMEGLPERWNHNGISAEVVKSDLTVQILGRTLTHLILIRSYAEKVLPQLYLYSPEDGLVAIYPFDKNEGRMAYWLEGEHGLFSRDGG